jgi:hypothetical protein
LTPNTAGSSIESIITPSKVEPKNTKSLPPAHRRESPASVIYFCPEVDTSSLPAVDSDVPVPPSPTIMEPQLMHDGRNFLEEWVHEMRTGELVVL